METKSTFSFVTNNFEYAELGMKGGKEYHIKGYISTDEIDRSNDIVTKDCMSDMVTQIKAGNVKLDVEHSTFTGENEIPIGRIIDAGVDAKGLWVEAIINKAHDKFESTWKSIKDGFLDAFSIAYKVKSSVKDVVNGMQVTLLKTLELLNVAITGNPVNKGAKMTESFYKSMNNVLLKDLEESDMTDEVEKPLVEEPKVEEVKEPVVEEPKAEEKPVEEPVAQPAKAEEAVEEPVKEEPVVETPQIKPLDQIKSLQDQIDSKNKVIAEMKAKLEKPVMKGIVNTGLGEMPKVEVKSKSPLEHI